MTGRRRRGPERSLAEPGVPDPAAGTGEAVVVALPAGAAPYTPRPCTGIVTDVALTVVVDQAGVAHLGIGVPRQQALAWLYNVVTYLRNAPPEFR